MWRVSDCTWVTGLVLCRLGLLDVSCVLMENEGQGEEEELWYVV